MLYPSIKFGLKSELLKISYLSHSHSLSTLCKEVNVGDEKIFACIIALSRSLRTPIMHLIMGNIKTSMFKNKLPEQNIVYNLPVNEKNNSDLLLLGSSK